MPLPCIRTNAAKQCHARTKATGKQCLNPAAYAMAVCRFHGARKKILFSQVKLTQITNMVNAH